MGKPTDLVQGTLDLLIFKTISLEPKHGWAIARRIPWACGRKSYIAADEHRATPTKALT
jgi:DNA-binding PadR family transcriptional regulator